MLRKSIGEVRAALLRELLRRDEIHGDGGLQHGAPLGAAADNHQLLGHGLQLQLDVHQPLGPLHGFELGGETRRRGDDFMRTRPQFTEDRGAGVVRRLLAAADGDRRGRYRSR